MNTTDMINRIRANNQTLGHKFLQAVADRLEAQASELESLEAQRCDLARANKQLRRGQQLCLRRDLTRAASSEVLRLRAEMGALKAAATKLIVAVENHMNCESVDDDKDALVALIDEVSPS